MANLFLLEEEDAPAAARERIGSGRADGARTDNSNIIG